MSVILLPRRQRSRPPISRHSIQPAGGKELGMPVVTLHGLKPEVKDARIVPVVVGGHCYLRTSTYRENKKNERPCSNATIDRSLSIEMKKRRKTTPMKRYNGFRRGTPGWVVAVTQELALECWCSTRRCGDLHVNSDPMICDSGVTNR